MGSRPGGPFLVSWASAPCVWGFRDVSLVFSFRAPLLPFLPSRGLLCCWDTLYALLPRSFVRSLAAFVCRLRAVLLLFLVPVSRFISLVLPLFLRILALSLCLLALLFVLFLEPLFALTRGVFSSASSSSSSALSSSSVPSESRPPGVSAVAASSTFARTASLSSVLAAASWFSFWFSPLAIFLLCCSPLGVV